MLLRFAILASLVLPFQESSPGQPGAATNQITKETLAGEKTVRQTVPDDLDDLFGDNDAEDAEDESPAYDVSVLMVKADWRDELAENKPLADELRKLYQDADLSNIKQPLEQIASQLLFPVDRATVYRVEDSRAILARLTEAGLVRQIDQTAEEPEDRYGLKSRVSSVSGKDIPLGTTLLHGSGPYIGEIGPFSSLGHDWTLRVAAWRGDQNDVVCDRQYTVYIETRWPVKSRAVEKSTRDTRHLGCRFELPDESRAFLRWHTPARRQMVGGFHNLEDVVDGWFPVVGIAHISDQAEDEDIEPQLRQPSQTSALNSFDYRSLQRFGGRGRGSAAPTTAPVRTQQQQTVDKPTVEKASHTKVFQLQMVAAQDAANILTQLLSEPEGLRIATDVRTNSILASAPQDSKVLDEIEQVLIALDTPPKQSPAGGTQKSNGSGLSGDVSVEIMDDILILKGDEESVAELADRMKDIQSHQLEAMGNELQLEAVGVAERYLKSQSDKKAFAALRELVRQEFEIRQRLQLAEIGFLKTRLENLENRLQQKEQLKQRIIDRRIESLLEGLSSGEGSGNDDESDFDGFTEN